MIITKEQALNLFKEIGLDNAAMDLGLELGTMKPEENDKSWNNIIEALKEFLPNDDENISDTILEIECYESK